MYSNADGRFLPDRYIEGTCPNCGFESARGDQCDNCTKQLDPVDLINPRSTISGSTDLELRETSIYSCANRRCAISCRRGLIARPIGRS